MKRKKKIKKRQIIARDYYKSKPRGYDEDMEIWHAIFSTVQVTKKFINDLEKLCIRHDMRMVLTKQKNDDKIYSGAEDDIIC